ncbi:MAG: FliI/YscN family ATPase [Pseudomonadota bacterium]
MTTLSRAQTFSPAVRIWGTVIGSDGSTVRVAGLGRLAGLGDFIEIETGSVLLEGEVIAVDGEELLVLLYASPEGLRTGQQAVLAQSKARPPSTHWLGKVLDAFGHDDEAGRESIEDEDAGPRPAFDRADRRRPLGSRLSTGLAALDTLLPLCRGQRLGVFAGSGVGKSRLMSDLSLGVSADVVVIGLIGERTREVGDFVRLLRSTGGLERTVIIAATSDQSALVKRRAADLTMETAELFRDQGHHVLCLFDSVTRYAEAHREIALAAGEPPALRAFPPSTSAQIAKLCERAGPGQDGSSMGDITAIFTVLVSGSDMEEPIADMVRGILDGHIVLERTIAERGRFPAIDLRRSVSRSAPAAWSPEEELLVARARQAVALYEEAAPMIQAGLYQAGADPALDEAVALWPALDQFIGTRTVGHSDSESFDLLQSVLVQQSG